MLNLDSQYSKSRINHRTIAELVHNISYRKSSCLIINKPYWITKTLGVLLIIRVRMMMKLEVCEVSLIIAVRRNLLKCSRLDRDLNLDLVL